VRSDADDPGATLGAQRSADPLHPLHGGSPSPPLTERIESIDALRGFALVGILFINIIAMGGPIESERPAAPPSLGDADWLVWLFGHLFVYGSMRGIFSGFGLGLWNRLSWAQMWALVPVIMLPMSLACLVWLGKFRMGPLEWVWRRLTFGSATPPRR